jgi:pilus assembly protein CpaE
MKIALISPSKVHLTEMSQVLQGPTPTALHGAAHELLQIEGGRSRLAEVVETHHPDLVLVDGMGRDPDELEPVEQVTSAHPQLAVVMLCAQQSPEFLLRAMRAGVREVLGSPPTPASLLMAVERVDKRRSGAASRPRGRVLGFASCKGGSGATFIAANLAYQLAAEKSVLLIDLNLQFGDALGMLSEQKPALSLADVAREIDRLDAAFLGACTARIHERLSVLAAAEEVTDGLEVRPEHLEAIVKLARRHYDFVLLDLERHLDPLSIRAMDLSDQLFVVMQAGLPWLRNARRLQKLLAGLSYPADKVHWLVNRAERGDDIGLDDIAQALGVEQVRSVANDWREVSASINQGTALIELARSSAVVRNLAELARSLGPQTSEPPSLLSRLFRRA